MRLDCQRLGLDLSEVLQEDSDMSRRIEAQLDAEESNCRFQSEFLNELENQLAEEWTVARRRLPRLHDWLDSWESRIKPQIYETDSVPNDKREKVKETSLEVDTFVGKKIQEIRADIEWIQLLRGDELAEEHWSELRPIIGLGSVTNPRDITLGHLLNNSKMIRDNVDRVKVHIT